MTIEEACAAILGRETANAITLKQGVHWAVAAAMAVAKTSSDPEALAAINHYRIEDSAAPLTGGGTLRGQITCC